MRIFPSNPLPLKTLALSSAVAAALSLSTGAVAHVGPDAATFKHQSTFDVMAGNGSAVAEISDVSEDGKQLVYTDAEKRQIGFVDIAFPTKPKGLGTLEMGGEPTSLVIRGPHVLVGVNTSASFTQPSGKLVVVDRFTRQIIAQHELPGQPDSLALAPDHRRAAIVIENERDEDTNDGLLPQPPSGKLLIVDLTGTPKQWKIREADLSAVAASAPNGDDLEPEYVDVNKQNEAVVSFQENNYLAVIDMVSGKTLHHFSAGSVDLKNIDTAEDDLITFNATQTKRREPDAVTWISNDVFATANEGDYEDENGEEGGSRSFTLFNQNGTVVYESAEAFEHWLASAGHYNEGRSENKGCEPEGIDAGKYGSQTLLFVGSERCNVVAVYDVTGGTPKPLQLLPTGIGPEGLKTVASKGVFIASTETAEAGVGIPTMINIFRQSFGPARYPMIASETVAGTPIPWVALSGMVGDSKDANTLYAVSDAFLAEGFMYKIDAGQKPAKIVERIQVRGASAALDLEGIAQGADGHFWLGSEGNANAVPNLVLKVAADGTVVKEIPLPAALIDQRRANGFEGIAVTGKPGEEMVYVAIQRAWPKEGDIDQVNTKIGRYDVKNDQWTFAHYPLQAQGAGDWVGLSELTLLPNGKFAVVERDKGWGSSTGPVAELKALYEVDLAAAEFRPYGSPLVTLEKTLLRDVLPDLRKASIWTTEKLEGVAVAADGKVYLVTDNDGLDDATGETLFLTLGHWKRALSNVGASRP